jgi:hypothetical protein
MQIAPPFGYKEVVPFLKTHKVRLPATGDVPAFVRESNAMPVSYTEFQHVAREYPIVFASGDQAKNVAPVAVLGMAAAENLFVRDGTWERGTYVPAYVRRYPFCMARVKLEQSPDANRLICVEKGYVDDQKGEAAFDGAGKPTPRWADLERLLSEYESDLERTREMCAILGDYGLLEPFTMQASLAKDKGGAALQLTGMQRVNEKSLENLNAAQLKNLMRKGILARIYLHLLSLENFSRLLERKAAGTPSARP